MAFNYSFRVAVSLAVALLAGVMWTVDVFWGALCTALLPIALYWQQKLYRHHVRKVLFMLDAIENNDNAIHFSETENTADARLVNRALNRVAHILYNVKSETAQQEKYYELILDCVNTGILVLNDNGAVYQKNSEALRLLGLNVFTHVSQLNRVDPRLSSLLANCRPGDKLQMPFNNERGTVNMSVRVSDITVRKEHLRILALNDINNELDEKEIDSWIRLTRVLTHEIMNSITPIISLSETLSEREMSEKNYPVMRQGMQTIHRRSKGLLEFVENYRKLTRLPAPVRRPVAVRELLQDLQKLFSEEYIRIELPETDRILQIDRTQIEQVLINLIKNAKEACSRKEHPRIEVKMLPALSWQCLITVSDNGEGILPEVQDKIFVPFFTTKPSGSGIGLSLCKQVMNRHGGNITVQSTVGKGSCFTLLFG